MQVWSLSMLEIAQSQLRLQFLLQPIFQLLFQNFHPAEKNRTTWWKSLPWWSSCSYCSVLETFVYNEEADANYLGFRTGSERCSSATWFSELFGVDMSRGSAFDSSLIEQSSDATVGKYMPVSGTLSSGAIADWNEAEMHQETRQEDKMLIARR